MSIKAFIHDARDDGAEPSVCQTALVIEVPIPPLQSAEVTSVTLEAIMAEVSEVAQRHGARMVRGSEGEAWVAAVVAVLKTTLAAHGLDLHLSIDALEADDE